MPIIKLFLKSEKEYREKWVSHTSFSLMLHSPPRIPVSPSKDVLCFGESLSGFLKNTHMAVESQPVEWEKVILYVKTYKHLTNVE